jgi:hypothetical protein
MITYVQKKQAELVALCREFKVKRLELFGSATGTGFDQSKSDIDFLIEFESATPSQHAARYFGLLAALQKLFGCNIDLVEIGAVRNPFFKKDIESSRKLIYGK